MRLEQQSEVQAEVNEEADDEADYEDVEMEDDESGENT